MNKEEFDTRLFNLMSEAENSDELITAHVIGSLNIYAAKFSMATCINGSRNVRNLIRSIAVEMEE